MSKFLVQTVVSLLVLGLSCGTAMAQTWGEIEGKGGKGLNGAEVKQVVSGNKMRGQTAQGIWYEWDFKPDGAMGGYLETLQGQAALDGKWFVNEKHQLCWDYNIPKINRNLKACTRLIQAGGENFMVVSGSGKDARVAKREFTK